jgi:hypothetical protein
VSNFYDMKTDAANKLKDGASCEVIGCTHKGKFGIVRDIKTGKTGHFPHRDIPRKFANEMFRSITGAIAGDQVTCGIAGVRLREYMAIIAERQAGKSYLLELACGVYTKQSLHHLFEPLLILHGGDCCHRSSGIGVQKFLPGSPNSFVDELTRGDKKRPKNEPAIVVKISDCWQPVARLITVQGEGMALFARIGNPDWAGQALSALITDLYDGLDAEVAITGDRATPKIPVRLQYSMLLCTQPRIWRKFMADHLMDSGLFGRFYIVGSEQKPKRVLLPDYAENVELFEADFGGLRRDVVGRLTSLVDHPLLMPVDPRAKKLLKEWEDALPDTGSETDLSSRMGLHAFRAAMARAWGAIPQRDEITLEDAEAAVQLGTYRLAMRTFYAPTVGDRPYDVHLNRVRDCIKTSGRITWKALREKVNATRFENEFAKIMEWLVSEQAIVVTPAPRKSRLVTWVEGHDL